MTAFHVQWPVGLESKGRISLIPFCVQPSGLPRYSCCISLRFFIETLTQVAFLSWQKYVAEREGM